MPACDRQTDRQTDIAQRQRSRYAERFEEKVWTEALRRVRTARTGRDETLRLMTGLVGGGVIAKNDTNSRSRKL